MATAITYADLPDAYRFDQRTKMNGTIFVGTIKTNSKILIELFGEPRTVEEVISEWAFVDILNRPFSLADDGFPATTTAEREFMIYALSDFEGRDFTAWLADRVYAHAITRGVAPV